MNGNRRSFGSDFAKLDAHVVGDADYAEIPELTDEMLDRADLHVGGKPVRSGRPKSGATKALVSLRIDRDVLEFYRATGPGWQSRVNAILRKEMA